MSPQQGGSLGSHPHSLSRPSDLGDCALGTPDPCGAGVASLASSSRSLRPQGQLSETHSLVPDLPRVGIAPLWPLSGPQCLHLENGHSDTEDAPLGDDSWKGRDEGGWAGLH